MAGSLGSAARAARLLQRAYVSAALGFLERLWGSPAPPAAHAAAVRGLPPGRYALYVHMPFCRPPLCAFCSFVRYPYREPLHREYMGALRLETWWLASAAEAAEVDEVYIGGGTPTVDVYALAEYIDTVREAFGRGVTVSVEANPRDLGDEAVSLLRGRVARVSIGVQALEPRRLRRLGRLSHSVEEAVEAVERASKAFPVVNVDMVWGESLDTPSLVAEEAGRALSLGASQATFYPLMPPPGSWRLYRSRRMGPWHPREEEMYLAILDAAAAAGYRPATPWCMARPGVGMVDEYVVDHEWFLGLGVSAVGRLPGYVYVNEFSPQRYAALVRERGHSAARAARPRPVEEAAYTAQTMLFGLRFCRGLLPGRYGAQGAALEAYIAASLRLLGEEPPPPGGCAAIRGPRALYALHVAQRSLYMAMNWLRERGLRGALAAAADAEQPLRLLSH